MQTRKRGMNLKGKGSEHNSQVTTASCLTPFKKKESEVM